MRCPKCNYYRISVRRTVQSTIETIYRNRKCPRCSHTWRTVELPLPAVFMFRDQLNRFRFKRATELMDNPPLIDRCIDAYWDECLKVHGIHSRQRMQLVFELLAEEISQWAPSKEQAKICYLAINEVADRLRTEGRPTIPGIPAEASEAPLPSAAPSDPPVSVIPGAALPNSEPAAPVCVAPGI